MNGALMNSKHNVEVVVVIKIDELGHPEVIVLYGSQ